MSGDTSPHVEVLPGALVWWQDERLVLADARTGKRRWETSPTCGEGAVRFGQFGRDPDLLTFSCGRDDRSLVDVSTGEVTAVSGDDAVRVDGGRGEDDSEAGSDEVPGRPWQQDAPGVVGSVVVERDGTTLTGSDPFTGAELWRTSVELADEERVVLEVHPGERATVVLQLHTSEEESRVLVLDGRTGDELASTRNGAWDVQGGADGGALLTQDDGDEVFHVVGPPA